MKKTLFLFVIAVVAALSSCKKENTEVDAIIGNWKATSEVAVSGVVTNVNYLWTFEKNGTFIQTLGQFPGNGIWNRNNDVLSIVIPSNTQNYTVMTVNNNDLVVHRTSDATRIYFIAN